MPAAPRANNKATKIFYKVMGVPEALKNHKNALKKSSRDKIRTENAFYK